MMAMQPLHIFRAGTFIPMAGAPLSVTPAELRAMASAYAPNRHRAPLVIGHPAFDAPAHGWVDALSVREDGLYASVSGVDPAFASMVRDGRYKKISASFFLPGTAANPSPGLPYLKHVGFLGAMPPAIPDLRPVAFAAGGPAPDNRRMVLDAREHAVALREARFAACRLAAGEVLRGMEELAGLSVEPDRLAVHQHVLAWRAKQPHLSYAQALSQVLALSPEMAP